MVKAFVVACVLVGCPSGAARAQDKASLSDLRELSADLAMERFRTSGLITEANRAHFVSTCLQPALPQTNQIYADAAEMDLMLTAWGYVMASQFGYGDGGPDGGPDGAHLKNQIKVMYGSCAAVLSDVDRFDAAIPYLYAMGDPNGFGSGLLVLQTWRAAGLAEGWGTFPEDPAGALEIAEEVLKTAVPDSATWRIAVLIRGAIINADPERFDRTGERRPAPDALAGMIGGTRGETEDAARRPPPPPPPPPPARSEARSNATKAFDFPLMCTDGIARTGRLTISDQWVEQADLTRSLDALRAASGCDVPQATAEMFASLLTIALDNNTSYVRVATGAINEANAPKDSDFDPETVKFYEGYYNAPMTCADGSTHWSEFKLYGGKNSSARDDLRAYERAAPDTCNFPADFVDRIQAFLDDARSRDADFRAELTRAIARGEMAEYDIQPALWRRLSPAVCRVPSDRDRLRMGGFHFYADISGKVGSEPTLGYSFTEVDFKNTPRISLFEYATAPEKTVNFARNLDVRIRYDDWERTAPTRAKQIHSITMLFNFADGRRQSFGFALDDVRYTRLNLSNFFTSSGRQPDDELLEALRKGADIEFELEDSTNAPLFSRKYDGSALAAVFTQFEAAVEQVRQDYLNGRCRPRSF